MAGIMAGLCAGTVGFVVQTLGVVPLIHEAETFEAAADARARLNQKPAGSLLLASPDHPPPLLRAGLTLAASLTAGAGFGLLLAGAITFSGRDPNMMEGVVWGFAGFAVFSLAPALVVPPHLPGMAESDLFVRQLWWLGAAGVTAAGLGLAAFAHYWPVRVAGLVLLGLLFIAGGPAAGSGAGVGLPAALVADFVVATMSASAVFWAVLGVFATIFLTRFSQRSTTF